jgi:hypothetical protein
MLLQDISQIDPLPRHPVRNHRDRDQEPNPVHGWNGKPELIALEAHTLKSDRPSKRSSRKSAGLVTRSRLIGSNRFSPSDGGFGSNADDADSEQGTISDTCDSTGRRSHRLRFCENSPLYSEASHLVATNHATRSPGHKPLIWAASFCGYRCKNADCGNRSVMRGVFAPYTPVAGIASSDCRAGN